MNAMIKVATEQTKQLNTQIEALQSTDLSAIDKLNIKLGRPVNFKSEKASVKKATEEYEMLNWQINSLLQNRDWRPIDSPNSNFIRLAPPESHQLPKEFFLEIPITDQAADDGSSYLALIMTIRSVYGLSEEAFQDELETNGRNMKLEHEQAMYFAGDLFKRLTKKVLGLFADQEDNQPQQIAFFHSQLTDLHMEIVNEVIRIKELPQGIDELNGFLWALITAMHPSEGHTTKEEAVIAGLTKLYDLDGDLFSSKSYGRMRNNYLLSIKMLSDYHTYDIIDFTTRLFYSFM